MPAAFAFHCPVPPSPQSRHPLHPGRAAANPPVLASAHPPSPPMQPPDHPHPHPHADPLRIRSASFNASGLDRLNNRRKQPDFLHAHTDAASLFLVFSHSLQVLTHLSPTATLALLPPHLVPPLPPLAVDPPLLLLGVDAAGATHLAVRLPHGYNPAAWLASLPRDRGAPKFLHLRSAARTLEPAHAAVAAHARALFEFHARHAFCGSCGARTVPEQGGSRRRCERNVQAVEPAPAGDTNANNTTANANGANNGPAPIPTEKLGCQGMWFPRTDPVVIMLVVDATGDRVLLGRQKRYAGGLYSCLAGFMEHGEGVDDAVRREVHEESGVVVGSVRFFGSQAWPFPFSLMLGCVARTVHHEITVDQQELEDARWFSRDQVADMVERARTTASANAVADGELVVPPCTAIAGQMLAAYAAGDPITYFDPDVGDETAAATEWPAPSAL